MCASEQRRSKGGAEKNFSPCSLACLFISFPSSPPRKKNMQRSAAATPSRMAPSMSVASSKPALPAGRRGVTAAAAKRDGESVEPAKKNVSFSNGFFFFGLALFCSAADARSSWNFDAARERERSPALSSLIKARKVEKRQEERKRGQDQRFDDKDENVLVVRSSRRPWTSSPSRALSLSSRSRSLSRALPRPLSPCGASRRQKATSQPFPTFDFSIKKPT